MIEVGNLVKLKSRKGHFSLLSVDEKFGCQISGTSDPMMVVDRYRNKNKMSRPYRIHVLHKGRIWMLRFKENENFEHFFRRIRDV